MPRWRFAKQDNDNTAAVASVEDVGDSTARTDAQVRSVLRGVMAQRRSATVAFDYVAGLSPGRGRTAGRSRQGSSEGRRVKAYRFLGGAEVAAGRGLTPCALRWPARAAAAAAASAFAACAASCGVIQVSIGPSAARHTLA